mmetsp:Transcript_15906/g.54959  ORF Transcript_15906/g.54959 Transcript_15906/m.54959 type:complete len:265 (+) Transcript_15906:274-1068(+)
MNAPPRAGGSRRKPPRTALGDTRASPGAGGAPPMAGRFGRERLPRLPRLSAQRCRPPAPRDARKTPPANLQDVPSMDDDMDQVRARPPDSSSRAEMPLPDMDRWRPSTTPPLVFVRDPSMSSSATDDGDVSRTRRWAGDAGASDASRDGTVMRSKLACAERSSSFVRDFVDSVRLRRLTPPGLFFALSAMPSMRSGVSSSCFSSRDLRRRFRRLSMPTGGVSERPEFRRISVSAMVRSGRVGDMVPVSEKPSPGARFIIAWKFP